MADTFFKKYSEVKFKALLSKCTFVSLMRWEKQSYRLKSNPAFVCSLYPSLC